LAAVVEAAAIHDAEASREASGFDRQRRSGTGEIHGIVFGTMGKPTHVLVPGYQDPRPEHFAAWLDGLRAAGWNVTLTPALSFEGVLVDARFGSPKQELA
jgi:hypothetical protein